LFILSLTYFLPHFSIPFCSCQDFLCRRANSNEKEAILEPPQSGLKKSYDDFDHCKPAALQVLQGSHPGPERFLFAVVEVIVAFFEARLWWFQDSFFFI